jgi:chromosome segregation ATPase
MTLEELKAEAKKHGYKLTTHIKTHEQWEADKQELADLRKQRKELKANITTISKRIHILSTSIAQYEKKCVSKFKEEQQ